MTDRLRFQGSAILHPVGPRGLNDTITKRPNMLDLLYISITLGFFILMIIFMKACEKV